MKTAAHSSVEITEAITLGSRADTKKKLVRSFPTTNS
jgi:hypothetical protein